ncbi:Phosphatase 2C 70 [Hibiscus syriacus]|uniref:Phosphatase 2C 70 n=1 Tax=Hibiscus syriacus TaxID=106335 RepID=A0A6A3CFT3_HIBSY|nr:Phosphatase 2C 70 [Hibiscus syriacus]
MLPLFEYYKCTSPVPPLYLISLNFPTLFYFLCIMATIVCHHHHQGLQSCLESPMIEQRVLRLTLSSSRPHSVNSNPEPGGWSLLQAMFDGPRLSIEGNGNTYVHPLVKRSLSALSDKNLELCTENLGSETGSDDVLNDDIFSLLPSSNTPTGKQHKSRRVSGGKKAIGVDFPPPLTTISGAESLRVRPYREKGRLVITAEKAPYNSTIFRAERSNGRLRLCILKDYEEETAADEENDNNDNIDNKDGEEEEFENDSNTAIVEKEEEEMGRAKFERRESRGGGCGGGARCEGGGHEEQKMVKLGGFLGGYIHSFVLDLPV